MKLMRYILFIFTLLISFNSSLFSQAEATVTDLQTFVWNINTFNHLYPQEKVYLHFDNTGYYLDENIWFKSYVVTVENNKPSQLSKILYVELLTPEGKVMQTRKLKLENGQAHGDFHLKDSLYAGFYEIRAYTKCMLNFGEDIIFSRVFPVFDKPKNEGHYTGKSMTVRDRRSRVTDYRQKIPKADNINITFYPEGGNLIAGLSNKIAFKATDKQGKSIDVKGVVYNSKGEEVTAFSTVHQGMGAFVIYPDGNKYTVQVEYEGKKQKAELPQSIQKGYTVQVDNLQAENITVQINKTADMPAETIGLSFACRGKVYGFEPFEITDGQPVVFTLDKGSLPSGVIQITLFTAKGEILAERLAFVKHKDTGKITAVSVRSDYTPMSPIAIDFQAEDNQGDPVETVFSLAVRDTGTDISTNYTGNIMTNLLLSSEVKGYIENPAYYFEKDDVRRRMALDLLLMTQGWRRYSWQQMAGITPFDVRHGIESSLIMEGQILSDARKKEKENVDVTFKLYSADGKKQEGNCRTDSQGYFNFALQDFYGTADLDVETREGGKLKSNRIQLDRAFSPEAKYYEYGELNPLTEKEQSQTLQLATKAAQAEGISGDTIDDMTTKAHALSEIIITEQRKYSSEQEGMRNASVVYNVGEELDKIRDTGAREAGYLYDFILDLDKSFVYYTNENGGTVCKYKSRPVVFMINNMPPIDSTELEILDMDIVESIAISENKTDAFHYCSDCNFKDNTVVIFIYTKKGGYSQKQKTGIRQTRFAGFSNVREFHSPDYSYAAMPDEKDFRRTLYWNPNVKTDAEGKATVNFFTNSTAKDITVSAESVTAEGMLFVQ